MSSVKTAKCLFYLPKSEGLLLLLIPALWNTSRRTLKAILRAVKGVTDTIMQQGATHKQTRSHLLISKNELLRCLWIFIFVDNTEWHNKKERKACTVMYTFITPSVIKTRKHTKNMSKTSLKLKTVFIGEIYNSWFYMQIWAGTLELSGKSSITSDC